MLMEAIRSASSVRAPGFVRGLGLASILQLMNWERRSATLTVKSPQGTGYLYVQDGELIHAALGREAGLIAAYQILSWETPSVEFIYKCKVQATIDIPLAEILLNMALFRDMKDMPVPPPSNLPDDIWKG
jgi:hypothetical protein